MNIPKLKFIYAHPLDQGRRVFYKENNLSSYPTRPEIAETMKHWRELWAELDSKHHFIEQMIKLTGRTPTRNLECFVYGTGLGITSSPFLLPTVNPQGKRWSDEKFIDVILHETLHIFLTTDNEAYWKMATEKYAAEAAPTRNHILLYAMLFELYEQNFGTESFDSGRDNLPPGYARAIELVKETGYRTIIEEYRAFI